jgi:hypothetical protein
MSRIKEYLEELRESGRLVEEEPTDFDYELYVKSLNDMNELFNVSVEEAEQDEIELKSK